MPRVVGVRFKPAGKIYYFAPGSQELQQGEQIIVETSRGRELGMVALGYKDVPDDALQQPLKKVLRRANKEDLKRAEDNRAKEKEAFARCRGKISEHGLIMKLVDVDYSFDGSKIVFFFTSEDRVDFRGLVKDLASMFKTRIELRQIGVRDEAKIKGGIGPCGRAFCCSTFLEEFEPVSIRMAKGQNLSLNPTKISGVCGRLMCCLRYEAGNYRDARAKMPQRGEAVTTPDGQGEIREINVPRKTVTVLIEEGQVLREYCVGKVVRKEHRENRIGSPGDN